METKNDFDFYLKFTKPLILHLPELSDRVLASAWVRTLVNDSSGEKIKLDYIKLLLFVLQRKRLVAPFTQHPNIVGALEPLPEDKNLVEVAKELIEKENNEKRKKAEKRINKESGDFPPYFSDFSADLLEYAAVQTIENFGIHGYYAVSKEPLEHWENIDKQVLPKAAKSMIEVGAASPNVTGTLSSPELVKPKTPEAPPEEVPEPPPEQEEPPPEPEPSPRKTPKKRSNLGASPPSRLLGRIIPKEDREPPSWGSNLLEVKRILETEEPVGPETEVLWSPSSTYASMADPCESGASVKNKFSKTTLRRGGQCPSPGRSSGSGGRKKQHCPKSPPGGDRGSPPPPPPEEYDYDWDELAQFGLTKEDLAGIDLEGVDECDLEEEYPEFEEMPEMKFEDDGGFIDEYGKFVDALGEEMADEIAEIEALEQAGLLPTQDTSPRHHSPCPAHYSPKQPSPCPAARPPSPRTPSPCPRPPSPCPAARIPSPRTPSPCPRPCAPAPRQGSPYVGRSPPHRPPSPRRHSPCPIPGSHAAPTPLEQSIHMSPEAREILQEAQALSAQRPKQRPRSMLPCPSRSATRIPSRTGSGTQQPCPPAPGKALVQKISKIQADVCGQGAGSRIPPPRSIPRRQPQQCPSGSRLPQPGSRIPQAGSRIPPPQARRPPQPCPPQRQPCPPQPPCPQKRPSASRLPGRGSGIPPPKVRRPQQPCPPPRARPCPPQPPCPQQRPSASRIPAAGKGSRLPAARGSKTCIPKGRGLPRPVAPRRQAAPQASGERERECAIMDKLEKLYQSIPGEEGERSAGRAHQTPGREMQRLNEVAGASSRFAHGSPGLAGVAATSPRPSASPTRPFRTFLGEVTPPGDLAWDTPPSGPSPDDPFGLPKLRSFRTRYKTPFTHQEGGTPQSPLPSPVLGTPPGPCPRTQHRSPNYQTGSPELRRVDKSGISPPNPFLKQQLHELRRDLFGPEASPDIFDEEECDQIEETSPDLYSPPDSPTEVRYEIIRKKVEGYNKYGGYHKMMPQTTRAPRHSPLQECSTEDLTEHELEHRQRILDEAQAPAPREYYRAAKKRVPRHAPAPGLPPVVDTSPQDYYYPPTPKARRPCGSQHGGMRRREMRKKMVRRRLETTGSKMGIEACETEVREPRPGPSSRKTPSPPYCPLPSTPPRRSSPGGFYSSCSPTAGDTTPTHPNLLNEECPIPDDLPGMEDLPKPHHYTISGQYREGTYFDYHNPVERRAAKVHEEVEREVDEELRAARAAKMAMHQSYFRRGHLDTKLPRGLPAPLQAAACPPPPRSPLLEQEQPPAFFESPDEFDPLYDSPSPRRVKTTVVTSKKVSPQRVVETVQSTTGPEFEGAGGGMEGFEPLSDSIRHYAQSPDSCKKVVRDCCETEEPLDENDREELERLAQDHEEFEALEGELDYSRTPPRGVAGSSLSPFPSPRTPQYQSWEIPSPTTSERMGTYDSPCYYGS